MHVLPNLVLSIGPPDIGRDREVVLYGSQLLVHCADFHFNQPPPVLAHRPMFRHPSQMRLTHLSCRLAQSIRPTTPVSLAVCRLIGSEGAHMCATMCETASM